MQPHTFTILFYFISFLARYYMVTNAAKYSNSSLITTRFQRSCRPNGLKIGIIHLATTKAHWYSSHAQAINLFYARRHGYDFTLNACPTSIEHDYMWNENDQVRANWAKPEIIMRYLRDYHYVLMLDADAFVSEPSITIEEIISEYMTGDYTIVVPKNCMVGESRDPKTYTCWSDATSDDLNIGAILAKRAASTFSILSKWKESVKSDCKKFIPPQWKIHWVANDQQCLSLLYSKTKFFKDHIKVLNKQETFTFIGGSDHQYITHYLGGGRNPADIGNKIMAYLQSLVSLQTYSHHIGRTSANGLVWKKVRDPVFGGGELGTCFDISVLRQNTHKSTQYWMYFSWRPKASIALTLSADGMAWNEPTVVLSGIPGTWEEDVNRPMILKKYSTYYMWFTGQQSANYSKIGHARSHNGITWKRHASPVLVPELSWEAESIMCSYVIYNEVSKMFYMYYSAGHQYEPFAIGHASSKDGVNWTRTSPDPIFTADKSVDWEKDRVTCPTVKYSGEYYYMFYIGFRDMHTAAIGIARSRNGVDSWERHPGNPILNSTEHSWDSDAVYKPDLLYDGSKWMLWYNGRRGVSEQIGLATLDSHDFGFPD